MNLYELNALIAQLMAEDDSSNETLLNFYFKARKKLVAEIARKVQIGLRLI